MKIVVAPDSFKGCLSAREVASVIASAIRELHPDWEVVELPLADGGEGTVDVIVPALGGEYRRATVRDPLGRPVTARYGICGDTAVIEVAEACGLKLISTDERNPLIASSYGVGELLLSARAEGATHYLIGLGGTATCDGGEGMMSVPELVSALSGCTFELLSDVDNPLVGPAGAARVYSPQKGASPEKVEVLEKRMIEWADEIHRRTGVDVSDMPGAGAAGGLGAAFMAFFDAQIMSGVDRILDIVGFPKVIRDADMIITGEGRSDAQTLHGKLPLGVLRHAGPIPVTLLSGRIDTPSELIEAGFTTLLEMTPHNMPLEQALDPAVAAANIRASLRRNHFDLL